MGERAMMFVRCQDTPTGPCLQIAGSDWRVAEVCEQLRSLGVAHEMAFEDGTHRARLVVPVAVASRSAGAAQEARSA